VTTYLDIETTSKKADEGMIVAMGVLKGDTPQVRFAKTPEGERAVLEWLTQELGDCDLLVTWYGSGFDIPFILARAVLLGVDMERIFTVPSLDLYVWCKRHLLLSSYKLESVAKFLGMSRRVDFQGGDVSTLFKLTIQGDENAKNLIIEHCKEDLELLRYVHERMKSCGSSELG